MDITAKVQAMRAAEFAASEQLNLGQIIDLLEAVSDKQKQVQFPFGYMHPTELGSYRGIYAELAFGYTEKSNVYSRGLPGSAFVYGRPTVATVLDDCKKAVGSEFYGYKGGYFRMNRETPVWVANYSEAPRTMVIGVREQKGRVLLMVEHGE